MDNFARYGLVKEVETLNVLRGILPDFSESHLEKWNYLHIAVHYGQFELVEYLITAGFDVNERDRHGNTPLLCAKIVNCFELIRLLVANNADIYAVNNDGENVAHTVTKRFGEDGFRSFGRDEVYDWVKDMLKDGHAMLWSMHDNSGMTPFGRLCANPKVRVETRIAVKYILKDRIFDSHVSESDSGQTEDDASDVNEPVREPRENIAAQSRSCSRIFLVFVVVWLFMSPIF